MKFLSDLPPASDSAFFCCVVYKRNLPRGSGGVIWAYSATRQVLSAKTNLCACAQLTAGQQN
jgi:hypothetical protein